jgi:outer membrane protein
MHRILSLFTVIFLWRSIVVQAQVDTMSYAFNLNDCIQYALAHQHDVKNAVLDKQFYYEKVKETRGKLFPHVDINGSIQDNLKLPTSLIPDFTNGNLNEKIPVEFGTKWASTVLGQVNQTVFNSDYFLGLKAAKVYRSLGEKSLTRTVIETKVAVTQAYYAVLVNVENIRLISANQLQLKKTMDDTKARYDVGVAERIDVDRITVSYNNVVTQIANQERLLAYSLELLKFQMGLPLEAELVQKETVNDFAPEQELRDTTDYRVQDRIEYSQQLTQIELDRLSLKSTKLGFLPSLSAYANYGFNYFSGHFNELFRKGYPNSTVGLTFDFPIFSGTERIHQVREQKITLEKSVNDLDYLDQQIKLQVKDAFTQYKNNMALLNTQKTNIVLTQGIYDRIVLKFEQGVSTSLDVISAESDLKQAQSDYINALLNTLVSKVNLDKAMGKIR